MWRRTPIEVRVSRVRIIAVKWCWKTPGLTTRNGSRVKANPQAYFFLGAAFFLDFFGAAFLAVFLAFLGAAFLVAFLADFLGATFFAGAFLEGAFLAGAMIRIWMRCNLSGDRIEYRNKGRLYKDSWPIKTHKDPRRQKTHFTNHKILTSPPIPSRYPHELNEVVALTRFRIESQ